VFIGEQSSLKQNNSSRRFSTDKSATSDLVNGWDLKLADPEILGVSSNTMRRLANCQSVYVASASVRQGVCYNVGTGCDRVTT